MSSENQTITQLPPGSTSAASVPSAGSSKPEWCPDKFWDGQKVNSEALAKSYGELEKGRTPPAGQPPAVPGEAPKTGESLEASKAPLKEPQKAPEPAPKGADAPPAPLQPFYDEFAKDGKLAEVSYKKLSDMGLAKEDVDDFIAMRQQRSTNYEASVKEAVGGTESYLAMAVWAKDNLSPAELDAYDTAVNSGNVEQAKLAAQGLYSRFNKDSGMGNRVRQSNGVAPSPSGFASMDEVMKAMNDPRYKAGDPEYHAEVQQRLRASRL